MDRYNQKREQLDESLQAYPKLAARLDTLRDVWAETFPNTERDVKRR
jgi:hypothetical protein